jgi:hypothetical protein
VIRTSPRYCGPAALALALAAPGCTINSPLVCSAPPVLIDRMCPQVMPSPLAAPQERIPSATPGEILSVPAVPATPAFTVPRLQPRRGGGSRGAGRLFAGRDGDA